VVEVDSKNNQVNLVKELNSQEQPKSFSFDYVFGADCAQSLIYEQSAFSLVDNVLDGYNGTIFAYGQTGCGKTHTMMGTNESEESKGIIPRTFSQIVTITKNDASKTHLIRCSFMEIYNEEIHDLLSKDTKARMDLK
jgi:kinesin family protein 3/17